MKGCFSTMAMVDLKVTREDLWDDFWGSTQSPAPFIGLHMNQSWPQQQNNLSYFTYYFNVSS